MLRGRSSSPGALVARRVLSALAVGTAAYGLWIMDESPVAALVCAAMASVWAACAAVAHRKGVLALSAFAALVLWLALLA